MQQFQGKFAGLRKYKKTLVPHIPSDGLALGEYLIELPGFSVELRDTLMPLLNEALGHY